MQANESVLKLVDLEKEHGHTIVFVRHAETGQDVLNGDVWGGHLRLNGPGGVRLLIELAKGIPANPRKRVADGIASSPEALRLIGIAGL